MEYKATKEFAKEMDQNDPLEKYRDGFHFSKHNNGVETNYLFGNSPRRQPKSAKIHIESVPGDWQNLTVNLQFMMLSFYKLQQGRNKIV
jgi:kynureninase